MDLRKRLIKHILDQQNGCPLCSYGAWWGNRIPERINEVTQYVDDPFLVENVEKLVDGILKVIND